MIKLNKDIAGFINRYTPYLSLALIFTLFTAPVYAKDKILDHDKFDKLYYELLEETQLSRHTNITADDINIGFNGSNDIALSLSKDSGYPISSIDMQGETDRASYPGIITSDLEIAYEIDKAIESYEDYLLEKEIDKALRSPDLYTFNSIVIEEGSASENTIPIFKTYHLNFLPSSNNYPPRPERIAGNDQPEGCYKDLCNYNYINEICAGSYMFRLFLYIRQKEPDGEGVICNIINMLLPALLLTPSVILLNLYNKTFNHITRAINKIYHIQVQPAEIQGCLFLCFCIHRPRHQRRNIALRSSERELEIC